MILQQFMEGGKKELHILLELLAQCRDHNLSESTEVNPSYQNKPEHFCS